MYFYSDRWEFNYEAQRFLALHISGEDRSKKFGECSLERSFACDSVVFLLMGNYLELAGVLEEKYPGGTYQEIR